MENYIEARVVLGILCLIHVFVNYGMQVPWGHINKKVLDGVILTELIAVTVYIIYDNLQTPPYDGWLLAILGYILVYALILMTWFGYNVYTLLEVDKIYEMTITQHVCFMNDDYFLGTVIEGENKYEVLLPYSPELSPTSEVSKKQNVKFDNVLRGEYILVKLA